MKLYITSIAILLWYNTTLAQTKLTGTIHEINSKGDTITLPGANLRWLNTLQGINANNNGKFELPITNQTNKLIISYIGFNNDTATIDTTQAVANFYLSASKNLKQVTIVYRKLSSDYSYLGAIKIETIGQRELAKAACCNLSESFETNPSVDVNFADAVTGAKQIQMLGLSGQYSLITKENMPYLRGLASAYGLTFIPGTWIQSIQLIKGAGSVINGYESFTGQINTELQKPDVSERLYFNSYVNANARNEYNLNLAHKINKTFSTGLLLHSSFNPLKQDMNHDGFIDIPTGKQINVANRWNYYTNKGFEGQFGASYLVDNKAGGQNNFDIKTDVTQQPLYGIGINTEKIDIYAKNGYLFTKPETSMGLQTSYTQQSQNNFYGLSTYTGLQRTFYANYIFQSMINNSNNKYKLGASYLWDNVVEKYKIYNFKRIESVPGVFAEYAYSYYTIFNVVAGLRADYHNYYGTFLTPRLHLRYEFTEDLVLRASAGRALKTATVFAENASLMATSREFYFNNVNTNMPNGLNPEIAWNYGLNLLYKLKLKQRNAQFIIDAYRTDFVNQVIIDVDADTRKVLVSNLSGKSFSNTLQTEFNWEIIKQVDVRLAYRYVDTRSQYSTGVLSKALLSKHRAFINIGYETKNKHWQMDFTTQWFGKKRLPNTAQSPVEYIRAEYTPNYININSQVTYRFNKKFPLDIYVGVENATNYTQPNPIVANDKPFGSYFDASMVWASIYGRMLYGGLRFKIK
ncbi:MAG: TonB-dependent receptor [Bacteroidia bacterium]|nr:TonB-dependent receptor [Bacteroidia bacterium]